jgi:hypothetical protein
MLTLVSKAIAVTLTLVITEIMMPTLAISKPCFTADHSQREAQQAVTLTLVTVTPTLGSTAILTPTLAISKP